MEVRMFTVGPALANLYVVSKDGHGFIVDCADKDEAIDKYIKDNNIKIEFILQTHTHFDHVMGLEYYKNLYDVDVYASEDAKDIANDPTYNLGSYYHDLYVPIDKYLKDGEIIEPFHIKAIKTPGHTLDSMSFLVDDDIFTGDCLFRLSIGRYDFPGGDYDTIIDSIKNKICILDKNFKVYPGHRASSTIGYEIENNPFLK